MALTLKDRVLETCTSPGTGAVTLLGAVTGYQTFSSAIGNANTCYYTIADQNGANWEVGIGTYATSGNTLTRTTVLSSSNAGSTVNFATGTQNVFVTYPSERSVNLSSSALTSGRVTYATTDGLLTDSANMTFDGTTLTTAGLSDSGNLTFTGTGNRITGDMSNATLASRVAFQTSTVNSNTGLAVLPNGTATTTNIQFVNNSDPTNASGFQVASLSTEATLRALIYGTGTYLPLTMYTGGSERLRIDTSGNVGIGTTSNNVYDQVGTPRPLLVQRSDTSTTIAGSLASITISNGDTTTNNTAQINFAAITGASTNQYSGATISAIFGARTNGQYPSGQLVFSTSTATNSAPTEKMRITSAGLVGIGLTPSGTTVQLQVSSDALISGLTVGKGGGALPSNTVVGNTALVNNTGAANIAIGQQALNANTSGNFNTAVGYQSLLLNTSGSYNIGVGGNALNANTTGGSNIAMGYQALALSTTASNNTAVGYQAGYSNTTGTSLVYLGFQAGYATTTSQDNVAIGVTALKTGTTGTNANVAIGSSAMYTANGATFNVAVGFQSLYANTTASYNVALGGYALASNTTASSNTAVGYQAGYTNSLGINNTFIGYNAGYSSNPATGTGYNTCVGYFAGYSLTTGVKNTFIGSFQSGGTAGAGSAITSGSSNSILGAFTGNGTGLDIRTSNNYIVLSDGDGVPRQVIDTNGNVGMGTVSPGEFLHIYKASGDVAFRIQSSAGNCYVVNRASSAMDLLNAMNGPMTFSTNNTERMRIDSSGNVGIGTSSPGNQLNIVTTSNSVARQIAVRNTSAGSGAYSLIDIGNDTSGSAFDIGVLSSTNASYGGAGSAVLLANTGNLYLSTTGAYAMQFATNSTERMRIDSSGNLGIGTAGGTYGFDLSRSTTNGSTIRIYNSTASSSFLLQNDTAGNAYVQQQFNGPLVFATNNAEKMRIDSSGNVGIATTSPSTYKDSQGAVLVVGGSPNYATIQARGDGPTGYGNGVSYGGSYSTNPINGARMWIGAAGASGQRGGILFFTKDLDDNTTQPLERMRIASNGIVTMSAYGVGTATFSASGVISSVSDETWKIKDGVPTNPDAMIQKLQPGYWFYNEEKAPIFGQDRQLGFYAQNVNEAIGKEAAPTPEEGKPWGYYDRSVLAITVMSLKNALSTIEDLKQRIATLESK